MSNEAVRDARDAVLEAYDDSMTSPNFEADREHDDRFIAALDAYEAAIRDDERAKVEAYEELERTVRDLLAGHGGGSWAVEAALNRIDAVRAGRAS